MRDHRLLLLAAIALDLSRPRALRRIAREAGATINVLPVDLRPGVPGLGRPAAGQARAAAPGVPAGRAEALQRVPRRGRSTCSRSTSRSSGDDAAKLIIAVDMHDGSDAAMRIAGAILRAVWVEEQQHRRPERCCSRCSPSAAAGRAASTIRTVAGGARALRGGFAAGDRRRRVRRAELRRSTARCSGARTGSTSSSAGCSAASGHGAAR